MENIKRGGGFIASIVGVLFQYVQVIGLAILVSAFISAIFAFAVGLIYNLCIAPTLGWAFIPFQFAWGVFMVGWILAQWFKSFVTKTKEG